jgi:hypothetical protein
MPAQHADPNRPPRPDDKRVRRHPGNEPGDPSAVPAPEEDEHGRTKADRAEKRKHGTLEDGAQYPSGS